MISNPRYGRARGFTLLEILLVVLVVGITAAAFLPVALNTADQARTRSVLRQLISMNRYARGRAILEKRSMTVVYDPEESRVYLLDSLTRDRSDVGTAAGTASPPAAFSAEFSADRREERADREVISRDIPHTMRIRKVEGGAEQDGRYQVEYDSEGVAPSHVVELVDPRGEIRRIRFNGFTGEADHVE